MHCNRTTNIIVDDHLRMVQCELDQGHDSPENIKAVGGSATKHKHTQPEFEATWGPLPTDVTIKWNSPQYEEDVPQIPQGLSPSTISHGDGKAHREPGPMPYDTFSWIALERLVRVVNVEGNTKYGPNNWRRGLSWADTLNHLMRHFNLWLIQQQLLSNDSNEQTWEVECLPPLGGGDDHLAKVLWGIQALMEFEVTHPEMNDLFTYKPVKEV